MVEIGEDEDFWRKLPPGAAGGAMTVLILSGAGTEGGCSGRLPPGAAGGTRAVVISFDADTAEGCWRLPPGAGGGATIVVISFCVAAAIVLELIGSDALWTIGPGAIFDGACTALAAVRMRRAPGLPPNDCDDDDPPIVKFAQAKMVPLEFRMTTLRLPTKAGESEDVDKYGSK